MDDYNAIFMLGGLLGFIVGAFLIGGVVVWSMHRSAIEANVAEWRVDPKTGDVEFCWKPCGEGS